MCGITAIYGNNIIKKKELLNDVLNKIEHRGDKKREIKTIENCLLGCNRLTIVDRDKATQPIYNEDNSVFIVLNGEIYNYKELRNKLKNHSFKTDSDTEVLVHGYEEWNTNLLNKLDGQFAFVIYDKNNNSIFAARDPFGIKPLYYTESKDYTAFASEIKALTNLDSDEIKIINPGTYFLNNKIDNYFKLKKIAFYNNIDEIKSNIKQLFNEAVKKRVQTDLPIGVLLSGGIDSSTVLKYTLKHHNNVTAFCIGEENSPDLTHARKIANYLGVELITFNPKKIDVVNEVENFIYFAESFEPNLVNCLGVSYHVAELIKEKGIKIAIAGEGADETFAGYSEFLAMKPDHLQNSLLRYLNTLHRTQLQRVDRMSMAHQVEVRVPFLDKKLVEYVMNINPSLKIKNNQTKWILRETFRDDLPDYIINREKAPFHIGAEAKRKEFDPDDYVRLSNTLSNEEFESIRNEFPDFNIKNKFEAYYFRIFNKYGYAKAKFNQERAGMPMR